VPHLDANSTGLTHNAEAMNADALMQYAYHRRIQPMELRQIRSFVVLSEELHFGRAAARLFVAQPALSQQIKQLETFLNTQLFHRTSRSVLLTEAGKAFLPHATAALRNLSDGQEEMKSVEAGVTGTVAIGFVSTAAIQLIPDLLQQLKKTHPQISLKLRETDATGQVQGLLSGHLDIGFMHATDLHPGLESVKAETSVVEVALPSRHPLAVAGAQRIALKDLAGETLLLPAQTPHKDLYELVLNLCESSGFVPMQRQEVLMLQTALPLIAAGAGCALLPATFQRLRPKGVAFRRLAGSQLSLPIYAVTRRDGRTMLVRNVLKLIGQNLAKDQT
jgi:DNA-binding transcriptional LysR family regulator